MQGGRGFGFLFLYFVSIGRSLLLVHQPCESRWPVGRRCSQTRIDWLGAASSGLSPVGAVLPVVEQ